MVSSISNTDSNNLSLMMVQLYQKINTADTDGISGLSKNELSAIKTDDNSVASAFLKSLSEQFDKLDIDLDGELSAKEISSVELKELMGPPPGMTIASSEKTNFADDFANKGKNLSNSFIDKLLQNYKNGGLSNLVSAFGIAV